MKGGTQNRLENIMRRMEMCHNLFTLCLTGAAFFFLLTVIVFIRLDIRDTFFFLSGIQAKKEIRKSESKQDTDKYNIYTDKLVQNKEV